MYNLTIEARKKMVDLNKNNKRKKKTLRFLSVNVMENSFFFKFH